jgi:hypothetical protein
MSLSTPPPDAWGKDFDLDGQNLTRDWRTIYSGSCNGPEKFPPGKSANVSVKIPLWRQAQVQEFVNDPKYGYKGSIPALMRDAMVHRMMELIEHMGQGEVSPQIEAIVRRQQWVQEEEDRQAWWDHVEARKEAAKRDLDQAKGRVPLEVIEKIVAGYRQLMADDAWPPVLVEEMEQILVPAETAANNPLRSVK